MIKYRLKIVDIIEETTETKTYILERPEGFTWEAGAMTHVGLVGFDEGERPNKGWVRHMSICTLPNENKIAFTTRTRISSEFKERLAQLTIGDELVLFKTVSNLREPNPEKPIILLTTGVAIATARPLILSLLQKNPNLSFLANINIDSSREFVYQTELNQLENNCFKNYWYDSRNEFYQKIEQLTTTKDALYYVVGSDPFLVKMIQTLRKLNISDANIAIDKREQALPDFFGTNEDIKEISFAK